MTNILSAVVITKNEEKNIARCLRSLVGIADEIIVLDSFSTDRTEEICRTFPVKLISQEWKGYSATKNIGNSLASSDWILSLDADEELNEHLKKSILQEKEKGFSGVYRMNRLTNYCGKWIRHGTWFPDKKIRLFNRKEAQWEGDFVHEKLVQITTQNPQLTTDLEGLLHHYSYYTLAEHRAQTKKYSRLAALELLNKETKHGRIKQFTMFFSPFTTFFQSYFIKLGFLDGTSGFIIALYSAWGKFLRFYYFTFFSASIIKRLPFLIPLLFLISCNTAPIPQDFSNRLSPLDSPPVTDSPERTTNSLPQQTEDRQQLSTTQKTISCDDALWNNVYHKYRLRVIEECKQVSGIVRSVRHEKDGDLHIAIYPDKGQEYLLNEKNVLRQHGCLVVEPICVNAVTQADAVATCSGFVNNVLIPSVGSHIRVTGSYVLDGQHGWMEIHPVTKIEVLR